MKYYTGVGSRETPEWALEVMRKAASKLALGGWVLRSGGADGADKAFQAGWLNARHSLVAERALEVENIVAEIYLPSAHFNGNQPIRAMGCAYVLDEMKNAREAEMIAMRIHPAWDRCSPFAKKLHTRNVYQVLGQDLLTPSKFLVCWAKIGKDGKPSGGTRTAWELAEGRDVECFNIAIPADKERVLSFIGE